MAKWMRCGGRTVALIWAVLWFFFALVSGAGPGLTGVLTNAPNALPELVFLVAVAIVSVRVNALALSASQLWVCPDSSYYMALAGGITDHFAFHDPSHRFREGHTYHNGE